MRPQLSIIMPSFNVAPWIGQAIESLLAQQGPSWELLIVDDSSTDATRGIAARYAAHDSRIRLMHNMGEKGSGSARNTALAVAQGEAIGFLDSDDVFLPGALEALHTLLHQSGKPVVRGLGTTLCMQRLMAVTRPLSPEEAGTGHEKAVYPKSTFWLHLFRADFLKRNALAFSNGMPRGEDYTFLCRAYLKTDFLPVVEHPVHLYRINHKRGDIPASHAQAYLSLAFEVRSACEHALKGELVVPCLDALFLSRWLHCLYAVRQEGEAEALEYLVGCLALFAGREKEFAPAICNRLGKTGEPFLALWAKGNARLLLSLLEEHGLLTPAPAFIGMDRRPEDSFWALHISLRRAANLLRNPETRRALWYLAGLHLRALKRAYKHTTASGRKTADEWEAASEHTTRKTPQDTQERSLNEERPEHPEEQRQEYQGGTP